ncbi:hypothetical protein BASA50_001570 [Batrachochytrium salamandrivorans]|uniref:Protein kinase domain-containing protein n=1 Tax=Batrachochytrium salamandrivorans TaxID=1357716 RepID=A0ABQ8FNW1_9FUNG|nr:hypothetical protein BASA62_003617 [Batrachochytrium salamandrivorans]KAH6572996.1 hypothetical protein BASA60_006267 [Batrachochytrium salamandrivorans]KAH6597603.1 hypothetical protein BASA61_003103 [Batrachochytrium salamandrivorans]KAH6601532.1 hypothetical protein BASA50_001570 [Batrachochytrium salamandrivorans]KAH9249919.1 hypothetical protein BASA81_012296 [Batrachochytrium salamandrivorans]
MSTDIIHQIHDPIVSTFHNENVEQLLPSSPAKRRLAMPDCEQFSMELRSKRSRRPGVAPKAARYAATSLHALNTQIHAKPFAASGSIATPPTVTDTPCLPTVMATITPTTSPNTATLAVPSAPSEKKEDALVPNSARTLSSQTSHTLVPSDNGKRRWNLLQSLGKGGCGDVFLAQEVGLEGHGEYVALKIVKDKRQFLAELHTMKLLNTHRLGRGYTPKLIAACKKRRALVMDCHSESVATRFEQCNFKFSLKTVLMLTLNMMALSRDFYERTGQAHVDLKPSNFCTSRDGKRLILIDFGYSTHPTVCLPGQTGTPLFMSWSIQTLGATFPTWQDDLESLGYVIMFFLGGGKRGVPWGNLQTHRDLALAKNDTTIHAFCTSLLGTEYEPLAQPLATYLFVTRDRLRPFSMADFDALYQMFENVLAYCGLINDGYYDWCFAPSHANDIARRHALPLSTLSPSTDQGMSQHIPPPEYQQKGMAKYQHQCYEQEQHQYQQHGVVQQKYSTQQHVTLPPFSIGMPQSMPTHYQPTEQAQAQPHACAGTREYTHTKTRSATLAQRQQQMQFQLHRLAIQPQPQRHLQHPK